MWYLIVSIPDLCTLTLFCFEITIIQICVLILETNVYGDIKMGFMVSKGQLEIDIIVVKGLKKTGLVQPPGN